MEWFAGGWWSGNVPARTICALGIAGKHKPATGGEEQPGQKERPYGDLTIDRSRSVRVTTIRLFGDQSNNFPGPSPDAPLSFFLWLHPGAFGRAFGPCFSPAHADWSSDWCQGCAVPQLLSLDSVLE